MRIIYDIVIFIYNSGIGLASFFGNRKARLWHNGRKEQQDKLNLEFAKAGKRRAWFHCASLGEFEQGRQLIEELKSEDPSLFIVLSFFSPSGYEYRKNYPYADIVCYLPVDTRKNAQRFIKEISPTFVVFIKYEFWLHYFEELRRNNVPLFLVSTIFRPSQIFFKWYGTFFRKILGQVTYFFLQDENSARLLGDIGIRNSCVTGDTRFDRVKVIAEGKKRFEIIERFRQENRLFIAGSTWPEDENIYLPALKNSLPGDVKIVIAPHEISDKRISGLINAAGNYFHPSQIARYSDSRDPGLAKVLIIDNIGILSAVYGYSTVAWIGGGFGKGIHNILEAAVYGIPVLFGPNYKKFNEATELTGLGGAIPVKTTEETGYILKLLFTDEKERNIRGKTSYEYVNSHTGSTRAILSIIKEKINNHP